MFLFDHAEVTHESTVLDPRLELATKNHELCQRVGNKLAQHYPGVPWFVQAQIESGVVIIAIQGMLQYGATIHVSTLSGDPGYRAVMVRAGELLEALGMRRGKFSLDEWRAANESHNWLFNRNKKLVGMR